MLLDALALLQLVGLKGLLGHELKLERSVAQVLILHLDWTRTFGRDVPKSTSVFDDIVEVCIGMLYCDERLRR